MNAAPELQVPGRVPVDMALLARYDAQGPRYTSYPTAIDFSALHGPGEHAELARMSNVPERGLSLYLHLPFCAKVCFYCACNRIVTANRTRAATYLQRLHKEIELQSLLVNPERPLRQLHLGGGTPTYLSMQQMETLMRVVGNQFRLLPDQEAEYAIEIDPREADAVRIQHLRSLGFNRISLGVQDFDPRVQRAINRVQPRWQTREAVESARRCGFKSISMDLIYGLPHQSASGFKRTLQQAVALAPDRFSVFSYAHLPQRFKVQRQIDESALPSASQKLGLLETTIDTLVAAGYVHIGMDHFALPSDSLARAQRDGSLYRNFQGYSTHGDCDVIGCGVSAISSFEYGYSQNASSIQSYQHHIDDGVLAIERGLRMNDDDCLRRDVIRELICHFAVVPQAMERRHGVSFERYFAAELASLQPMIADGLLRRTPHRLQVTPRGRLLVRNICMAFDRYRNDSVRQFSRTI